MSVRIKYRLIPASILLLIGLLFLQNAFAQTSAWQWIKPQGGAANDYGKSVARDKDGNIYVLGEYNGTITSNGNVEIFIIRLKEAGQVLWAKNPAGLGDDYPGRIYSNGATVLLTGFFQSSGLDFGNGVTVLNNGYRPGFIVNYDSSGTALWANRYGGGSTENLVAPSMDKNGSIFIAGNMGSNS